MSTELPISSLLPLRRGVKPVALMVRGVRVFAVVVGRSHTCLLEGFFLLLCCLEGFEMSELERGRHLRLGGLLVFAASAAVVVFLSLAGSALAATSVTCTDSASDQALLQTAINGGGTVLVHGHCLGNWDVFNNVTLTGVGGAVLDGGGSRPCWLSRLRDVTINTLTIENGSAEGGGGILTLRFDGEREQLDDHEQRRRRRRRHLRLDFGFVNLTGTTVSYNTAFVVGGGILRRGRRVERDELVDRQQHCGYRGRGRRHLRRPLRRGVDGDACVANSAGLGGGIFDIGTGKEDTVLPAASTVSGVKLPAIPKLSLPGGRAASAAAMPKARPAVAPCSDRA